MLTLSVYSRGIGSGAYPADTIHMLGLRHYKSERDGTLDQCNYHCREAHQAPAWYGHCNSVELEVQPSWARSHGSSLNKTHQYQRTLII